MESNARGEWGSLERGFSFDAEKRDQEIKLANGNFEIRKYYFRSYS